MSAPTGDLSWLAKTTMESHWLLYFDKALKRPRLREEPMAVHALTNQFMQSQRRIDLGDRRRTAVTTHLEVRSILHQSSDFYRLGLDDVLIGSYAREVSIWPGEDGDVFGRLLNSTSNTSPSSVNGAFENSLATYAQERCISPFDASAGPFKG